MIKIKESHWTSMKAEMKECERALSCFFRDGFTWYITRPTPTLCIEKKDGVTYTDLLKISSVCGTHLIDISDEHAGGGGCRGCNGDGYCYGGDSVHSWINIIVWDIDLTKFTVEKKK